MGLVATGVLVAALAAPAAAHEPDETSLPVGETASAPIVGKLWTCQQSFSTDAPGAQAQGPWFNGDGTWDATKKAVVDGDVAWPDAELEITRDGDTRVITTKDLPTDHGHTHGVTFNGKRQSIYHYHATDDYPYTVGCFRGTNVLERGVTREGPRP